MSMSASSKKTKIASHRASGQTKQETIDFEPILIHVKDITTSIHLLSCQEENVVLAALISIDRYAAKSSSLLDTILQKGLKPKELLYIAYERNSFSPSSPVRRFAAKLLTRFVKILEVRESLPQGAAYCLASLQRDDGDTMHEFSSNLLAELTRGKSVSYAASLLICPPLNQSHPLKVLFTCLSGTADPDVIHNCLRNIWQILIAASAAPKQRHYISAIDQHLNLSVLPPLFQINYPSIQLLSMAVTYEATIRTPGAQATLSSSLPSLLTILESPSDRLLHCTVLALITKLVSPPPWEGDTAQSGDSAIPFVACDGPARLLKYLKLYEMEAEVRFWSFVAALALFSSPSAADILINHHQFHNMLPALVKDEDSGVATAAAHALCCIEHHPRAVEEVARSQASQHLAALAARWPNDTSVSPCYHQTFNGCSVAARALERIIKDHPSARSNFVYEAVHDSTDRKSTSNAGVSATSAAPLLTEKVSTALYCLEDVLERVGKLPNECVSSVLRTVATLASDGKLRLALVATEGLVSAVANCLDAPPYCPSDPEPPELPVEWPLTSIALECMLVERFSRESVWQPKNPAPHLSDPPLEVTEAACVTLGMLMLEPPAVEMFLHSGGAKLISSLMKKDESGFGRNSSLEAILVLIINCPTGVANALVRNGTLQWMIQERVSGRRSAVSTSWNAAIASLLRSNPSAKFQITGRLDPEDESGNLFYVVCPPPHCYSRIKSIDAYRVKKPKPHLRVFVACWTSDAEQDNVASSRARRRENLVQKQESQDSLEVDEDLLFFEATLKEQLQRLRYGVREMVQIIARFVWEIMAGPVRDAEFQKERHLEELKMEVGQGDIIPLGMVRMGSFTERAILFKVLADRLGLPVALVRSPYGRSWVEVTLVEAAEKPEDKEEENEKKDAEIKREEVGEEDTKRALISEKSKETEVERETVGKAKEEDPMANETGTAEENKNEMAEEKSEESSTVSKIKSLHKSKKGGGEMKKKKVSENARKSPEKEAPLYKPLQARLNIPSCVIRPNHVIDLMTKLGRLYPIGSYEANVYCGYELSGSESSVRLTFYSGEDKENVEEQKENAKEDFDNEDKENVEELKENAKEDFDNEGKENVEELKENAKEDFDNEGNGYEDDYETRYEIGFVKEDDGVLNDFQNEEELE